MDSELIKKYLDMFKVAIAIVVVALLASIFLLTQIIPQTISYFGNKTKYADSETRLAAKRAELETAKKNKERQEKLDSAGIEVKAFYRDIKSTGNSTADILAGEIQEINDLIKFYGIKMYKVNYNYDPAEDIFFKEKKDTYGVCKMNMELFASYMKFQSFMKDLYKHEHFLDIQSIEVNPYKKDKSILNIKMELSLYAEKDANAGKSREVPPSKGDDSSSNDLNLDLDI
ncbi:MAG: hypothetical protein NC390_02000 [Fusobacterium sp.]|nr:hypothetical protein [Fusobacterium sp.]